jgi:AcrR family transcriptional regulator
MSTAVTRKRILDAAEQVFGECGYKGASIRRITELAQVDLGAVRYHFGSKDGLFGEVIRRRVDPLCEERLRMLDVVESTFAASAPPVERIIDAFLRPALKLVADESLGRAWVKLIGRVRVEPGDYLDSVQAMYQKLLQRFLHAFGRALPEVPRDELAYRFYFLFGTEVNTLIDDGTLHALGQNLPDLRQDPEGVAERLIHFAAAGMRAPVPASQRAMASPFGGRRAGPEPKTHTRVG